MLTIIRSSAGEINAHKWYLYVNEDRNEYIIIATILNAYQIKEQSLVDFSFKGLIIS